MNEGAYYFAAVYEPPGTALMRRACPTPQDVPFFNRCMASAREMGLEWEAALAYVIEQRERLAGAGMAQCGEEYRLEPLRS